jgi:AraC-like DNA-binding protein
MSSARRSTPSRLRCEIPPLTDEIRAAIWAELLEGRTSATKIAGHFSISRRTLARHLRAEGCTFRQLSTNIRFEIACVLMANTDLPLGQIAAILKYSDLSVFTRAFTKWSGQSPSAWRGSQRRRAR